jgi:hypothetical protein
MVGDVEMSEGENICFQHIDIVSPEGKLLAAGTTSKPQHLRFLVILGLFTVA